MMKMLTMGSRHIMMVIGIFGAFVTVTLAQSNKCTCNSKEFNQMHPQVKFCTAEYALKIKVSEQPSPGEYNVRVLKDFKANLPYSEKYTIITRCSSTFVPGKGYYVTVKQVGESTYDGKFLLYMDACDIASDPRDIACTQRRGFGGEYDCQCGDECKPNFKDEPPYLYQQKIECFNRYGRCERYRRGDGNKCIRVYNSLFQSCFRKYRR